MIFKLLERYMRRDGNFSYRKKQSAHLPFFTDCIIIVRLPVPLGHDAIGPASPLVAMWQRQTGKREKTMEQNRATQLLEQSYA
jgi:hypothetical protein